MAKAAGQDEWSIQIKVNPTQVRDLLGHPVVYQGKGGRGKRGEAAPSVVGDSGCEFIGWTLTRVTIPSPSVSICSTHERQESKQYCRDFMILPFLDPELGLEADSNKETCKLTQSCFMANCSLLKKDKKCRVKILPYDDFKE